MDYRLPFPTLKHLTMVCIGKVLLDKKIRPFQKLWEMSEDKKQIYKMDVDNIVTPLSLSTGIKDDLTDVITGMFHQIKEDLLIDRYRSIKSLNNIELLFDGHGKLDISATWRRHFDKEVRNYKAVDPLLDLLRATIKQEMWYGIDAIFSRILRLSFRNSNVQLMRGKWHSICKGVFSPTSHMVYPFKHVLTKTASKVLFELFRHCEDISFNKDGGVVIPVNMLRVDYDEFLSECVNHGLNSDDSTKSKMSFIAKIILVNMYVHEWDLERVIVVLKDMNPETQLKFFDSMRNLQLSEPFTKQNIFYSLLHKFAEWPFIQWFMPFVNILKPYFTTHDYFGFVGDLVRKIPERGRFGAVYANLLVKYWDAIPPDVKEEFRQRGCNRKGCDHEAILKKDMELLAKKNLFLYALISTEMWPE